MTKAGLANRQAPARGDSAEQAPAGLSEEASKLLRQVEGVRDVLQRFDQDMHSAMEVQRQALFGAIRAQRESFRGKLEGVEGRISSPDIRKVISGLRTAELPPAVLTNILGEFLARIESSAGQDLGAAKHEALQTIRQTEEPLRRRGAKIVKGLLRHYAEDLASEGGLSKYKVGRELRKVSEELRDSVMTLLTSTVSDKQIQHHVRGIKEELGMRASKARPDSDIGPRELERIVQKTLGKGKAA